jgi:hypothetical protein
VNQRDIHKDWYRRREHVWVGERCKRCGMKADWPGARHGCEGVETHGELATRVMKTKRKRAT